MSMKQNLESLNGMLNTMNEHIAMYDDMTNMMIESTYSFKLSMKTKINEISNEEITNLTDDEISNILNEYCTDINSLKEAHSISEEYKDKSFEEFVKSILTNIKTSIDESNKLVAERDKINKEVNDMSNSWFEYINSDEYREKKHKRIETLKSKADTEEDPVAKKKILKMIEAMEKSDNFEFLFDRINEYPNKEIRNIIDIFFDNNRSAMVINKFKSRLPRYGYNKDIYKMFFNIEEKHLPEEYHDLNNIFLFHVMRFISFTDTYNKVDTLYVSTILIKLYNLLYHKFPTPEAEQEFVNIIKKFDDMVMPYIEEFKEKNITSPNNPQRKAYQLERDLKMKTSLAKLYEENGFEFDETLSVDELAKRYEELKNPTTNEPEEEAAVEEPDNNDNEEDSMVVKKVFDDPNAIRLSDDEVQIVEDKKVTVYQDIYNCYYRANDTYPITYNYYDPDDHVIEENISEETVLSLIGTNNVIIVSKMV